MKTDRFASVPTRAVAVLLTGLLFAASQYAGGQIITIHFGKKGGSKQSKVAAALAQQIGEAQKRFDENRRALRSVPGPDGAPAFPQEEVAGLIARTEEDLDQAIEQVGEPGLDAMRAWVDEEFRQVQEELPAPARTAALSSGLSTPRAVAVVASLEGFPLPKPASVNAAAPQQKTIPAETSNRLLDQAGEIVSRIFFLAKKDDLEVELWVGSTPAQKATFRFWSQGKLKGATPAPLIIRTNGKRERVLRGLYSYRAAWTKGAVTELVEYPNAASAPANQSEPLDLVTRSSFFCCEFQDQVCRHVDDKSDCHP